MTLFHNDWATENAGVKNSAVENTGVEYTGVEYMARDYEQYTGAMLVTRSHTVIVFWTSFLCVYDMLVIAFAVSGFLIPSFGLCELLLLE